MRLVVLVLATAAFAACSGTGMPHAGGSETPGEAPGRAGGSGPASGYGPAVNRDTARVRAATAAFRALDAAVAAGYPRSVPHCLSHPELGAMGYHHLNRELLDDRVELERPEILLYSRTPNGDYVLNGVEYIVPYSARPPEATPPIVMGQELKRSDPLRLWYLHVWIWTENRAGLFADWNPAVLCRS